MSPRLLLLILVAGLGYTGVSVHAWGSVAPVPSESECRPYIEKALKELSTETTQEAVDTAPSPDTPPTTDTSTEDGEQEGSIEGTESVTTDSAENEEGDTSKEEVNEDLNESKEEKDQEGSDETIDIESKLENDQDGSGETEEQGGSKETEEESGSGETEEQGGSGEEKESNEQSEETENKADDDSGEGEQVESVESAENVGEESKESQEIIDGENNDESTENEKLNKVKDESNEEDSTESNESAEQLDQETTEEVKSEEDSAEENEVTGEEIQSGEDNSQEDEKANTETGESVEEADSTTNDSEEEGSGEEETKESGESTEKSDDASAEADTASAEESGEVEDKSKDKSEESVEKATESSESQEKDEKEHESTESKENTKEDKSIEDEEKQNKSDESEEDKPREKPEESVEDSGEEKSNEDKSSEAGGSEDESTPEEDLTIGVVVPEKLRQREHISQILKLDSESAETELLLSKTMDITLRDLKRLYDTAIQPLEILYKYRDLSNRHFGDPEIFSKPLILFMGPWSGGKSTIVNYLLDNEYKKSALRTGAEPSPAYFNILMWGEQEEVLDGTQLAADWTFSGLQKFGQGLLDRLRGLKLKSPLLEKVNIVEIPGILEIRKQVERLFPFNDACQWFIDRADIIFLVYDPSKLDVGPETEAILDQLKGREYQTRIILNKADQVKPEELMRVQGTLIWNISPLMSSSEPPVMYSTSLWSIPYEIGSPTRLLYAQERAFLRDLRDAIDKRVENKIASARRFAVRVRNHAKMVDCYLTTYYNHKSFFGNRKKVADDIIEHPQNYHIYEGLSTLTNISRYDLPDPEVYRDFFRLNPVYDFQKLSSTCTYFRGCPINRLDVAIAYDLPELVGKYKKSAESVLATSEVPPKS